MYTFSNLDIMTEIYNLAWLYGKVIIAQYIQQKHKIKKYIFTV